MALKKYTQTQQVIDTLRKTGGYPYSKLMASCCP